MQAVVVRDFGGLDQLVLDEVADPTPAPGQIRIAVHAAGTNPVDVGNRVDGSWAGLTTPYIPGYDIAGVVEQVGSGVTSFTVDDRVMAMSHFPSGGGGYAELAVVNAHDAARPSSENHLCGRGGDSACRWDCAHRARSPRSPSRRPAAGDWSERRRGPVPASTRRRPGTYQHRDRAARDARTDVRPRRRRVHRLRL